ncbi:MAG: response regulator transcription factor [Betaproteobacteria bacterium]|nr:response regulator transcription factor [Betaproteobacteria bacterium]
MIRQDTLRVLLVEDDPAHLEQYLTNLAGDPSLANVGGYSTGKAALEAVAALAPDVALVDLGLPDMEGFDLIRGLRARSPSTDVLVVSVFASEYHLLSAIEAGATGYLLKDAGAPDFNAAIHAVHAGESPISPALARHLLRRCIGMAPANPEPHPAYAGLLSPREVEILESIARGESLAEIGRALYISPHTVKTHVKNIYRKLEAHSRPQAVQLAKQRGLIRP